MDGIDDIVRMKTAVATRIYPANGLMILISLNISFDQIPRLAVGCNNNRNGDFIIPAEPVFF